MGSKKKDAVEGRIDLPSKKKGLCSLLSIRDEKGRVIARLDIKGRSVVFQGKCDEAARAFFRSTKAFIVEYIKESLAPKPEPEEVEKDQSRLARGLRKLGIKQNEVIAHNIRDGRLVIVTRDGQKLIV